jgi:hypothetical protein
MCVSPRIYCDLSMTQVTDSTLASEGGKSIYCPQCNNRTTVYHFQWTALQCYHCEAMVNKHDWYLQPNLNPDSTMEQTKKYPTIDWTKNEYHQLKLAVDALKAICTREDKRHQMDEHLDPHTRDVIEEVIGMLEEEIDYDPTPNEPGEPPITAAEIHAAAWKEHQEMHR